MPAKTTNSGRGNTDTTYSTYFVPFVRDSQNYVNASLIINTSPSDTGFYYKCDWQYSEWQNNANGYSDTAKSFAVFFMVMDRAVFGHTKFKITDTLLFRQGSHKSVSIQLDSSVNGGKGNNYYVPVELCQQTTTWSQNCPWLNNNQPCYGPGGSCDNCPSCIEPATTTYCWTIWALVVTGGGSSSGTGGTGGSGGSGGSSTPPNCQPVAVKGANANPNCEPGWQPDPTQLALNIIGQLENWDDSIIINPSVRPCTLEVLDSIRNLGNGSISSMIYFMSLQVPAFNWEIREVTNLPSPYTTANAVTTLDLFNPFASTELNQAMMGDATDISVARTILHEAIHAFLMNWTRNAPQLTQAQKDSIFAMTFARKLKRFIQLNFPGGDAQHNFMAVQFKNDIKNTLKVLCPKLGINLPAGQLETLCDDMAWGGLQDPDISSPWMTNLSNQDRARILARNNVELNNLPGFSGNIDIDGVPYYVSLTRIGTKICP